MGVDQDGAREQANAVLRGGPLDGETIRVSTQRAPIAREIDGKVYYYAPTGEVDDEFPTFVIFAYIGP
jgi:hypothetical protein